jgi:RNA polymerase sigma-70 factor (ECF subfamily)
MTKEEFTISIAKEQKSLRRFLLALCCGDKTLADDIAQETFIKAYLSLEQYHEKNKFSAWLKTIAHNTFLDSMKSHKIYLPLDYATTEMSNENSDSSFKYQELYYALNKLSLKERTTILLYYLEGYSIKEICDIICCTEDAVKQQLLRGRKHLKAIISHE